MTLGMNRASGGLKMQHKIQAEGFGVRLRPVQAEDAEFIVWLRNLEHVKGRVGDSATDAASQRAWLEAYFKRPGDYYFIVETMDAMDHDTIRLLATDVIPAIASIDPVIGGVDR